MSLSRWRPPRFRLRPACMPRRPRLSSRLGLFLLLLVNSAVVPPRDRPVLQDVLPRLSCPGDRADPLDRPIAAAAADSPQPALSLCCCGSSSSRCCGPPRPGRLFRPTNQLADIGGNGRLDLSGGQSAAELAARAQRRGSGRSTGSCRAGIASACASSPACSGSSSMCSRASWNHRAADVRVDEWLRFRSGESAADAGGQGRARTAVVLRRLRACDSPSTC